MPSYTGLASDMLPLDLTDPAQAQAWYNSLPPSVQAALDVRLEAIYATVPEATRFALQRYVVSMNGPAPGLGMGTEMIAALSALAQIGAQVGTTVYSKRVDKDLASQANSSNQAINQQNTDAAIAAQKAISEAQIQAAAIATQGAVAKSAIVSPLAWKWGVIGLGIVAVAAVSGIAVFKKRRK